jgi:hypothetical protein
MLREDKKVEIVRLSVTLPRMFTGRWALQSGHTIHPGRFKDSQVERWRSRQRLDPTCLRTDGRRRLWWFREHFYWDDDRHSAEDVKALVLQRVSRDERKLKSARALMKGEENGTVSRASIGSEVRRSVVERDGLRCVQCGAAEDLQFDHILPVALGGATSVENLQILCGDCNRAKSDAL